MGTLFYGGSQTPIQIDDRALAHVKVVIATKLRRSECFTLSWRHPDGVPRGRSTIWLHPSIPLRFVFDYPDPPELSKVWLEALATSANSSGGIMLVAEHFQPPPHPDAGADTAGDTDADEPSGGGLGARKIAVQELTIDTLTVAGAVLVGSAAGDLLAVPETAAP